MKIIKVQDDNQLKECIDDLKRQDKIALDLEFDKNLHRYGFNICLIQIQSEDTSYLIDPLSDQMNYQLIFSIIEDTEIEKVVFAFGEDLRLLNSLGCYPNNIHDLNISTRLLNYEPGSLSRYLNEILGLEVTKSAQLSNWYNRPLKDVQVKYAAEDVQYLIPMQKVLLEQAEKKSITHWIKEENDAFDQIKFDIDYDNVHIKEKDKKGLTEYQWHLLKKFLSFREKKAKFLNKPSFQVMNMDFLKNLVHNPDQLTGWDMQRGVIKSLRKESIKLELVELNQQAEEEALTKNISKTKWAKRKLNSEAYKTQMELKKKIELEKKKFWKPIQHLIKRDYGDHASTFLLSNKLIQDLIIGNIDNIPQYKRALFKLYSEELHFDISKYNL